MIQKIKPNWPKIIVNILAFIPLTWALVSWITGHYGPNPIQRFQQYTGDVAIILLLTCLSFTPLKIVTGYARLGKFKRTFGLLAFYYAAVHMVNFFWIDYGFNWKVIVRLFLEKWFLWAGLPAFIILLILAITSLKKLKVRLGKKWKPLHRYVYLAGVLVVIHYILVVKAGFTLANPSSTKPYIAAAVLTILLIARLPFKKWFAPRVKNFKPDSA